MDDNPYQSPLAPPAAPAVEEWTRRKAGPTWRKTVGQILTVIAVTCGAIVAVIVVALVSMEVAPNAGPEIVNTAILFAAMALSFFLAALAFFWVDSEVRQKALQQRKRNRGVSERDAAESG